MPRVNRMTNPGKQKVGHYRPTCKTPFKWRFAAWPIGPEDCLPTRVYAYITVTLSKEALSSAYRKRYVFITQNLVFLYFYQKN